MKLQFKITWPLICASTLESGAKGYVSREPNLWVNMLIRIHWAEIIPCGFNLHEAKCFKRASQIRTWVLWHAHLTGQHFRAHFQTIVFKNGYLRRRSTIYNKFGCVPICEECSLETGQGTKATLEETVQNACSFPARLSPSPSLPPSLSLSLCCFSQYLVTWNSPSAWLPALILPLMLIPLQAD